MTVGELRSAGINLPANAPVILTAPGGQRFTVCGVSAVVPRPARGDRPAVGAELILVLDPIETATPAAEPQRAGKVLRASEGNEGRAG